MFIQIQYGSDMCENEPGTVGWSCLALPVRKYGPAPQSGKAFLVLLLLFCLANESLTTGYVHALPWVVS